MTERPGTILLVDDDDVVRDVLAENLSTQGFEILQSTNGEDAVALAIQQRPDMIISDIVMPRMDGWDFCHTLRMIPSTKSIPFIFLTSLDKTPDKILGIKLGADDYLTKPFSPEEVVFKVKAILKRLTMRKELLEKQPDESVRDEAGFLISDVIEYLRHTHRTGLLAVYGPSQKGVIYIDKGEPVHAYFGEFSGESAVFEMIREKSLKVKYLEKESTELPRNINMSWQSLMTRILDSAKS